MFALSQGTNLSSIHLPAASLFCAHDFIFPPTFDDLQPHQHATHNTLFYLILLPHRWEVREIQFTPK
jgi:hypothetical protein